MKFNFFRNQRQEKNLQDQWNELGKKYAFEINSMVEYGEKYGWENWKGKEPEDKRDHMTNHVIDTLKEANESGTVDDFRKSFPPAHQPLVKLLEIKGQSIEQIHFIENDKIVFLTGTSYQNRQAYILNGDKITELDASIDAIGKSKRNEVFAILNNNLITTTQGWQGEVITSFQLQKTSNIGITEMTPFNDGKKILLTTSEGIYLISQKEEKLIHPKDNDDEDSDSYIDMENATISNNNEYIIAGDQCSAHRVLDSSGIEIGSIGQQSEYPHFCLFSKDDNQLITNSCHFYNGITIGIETSNLNGINIEEYKANDQYTVIDEDMRIYAGVATNDFYILGDAHGYIRAFNIHGKCLWRHFLGSTISGMDISENGKTLWVGSYSGMIHKLRLGEGHRDEHTIGNGKHYEEFRLILWKDEEILKW